MHAITAANNLLSAAIDNHIHHGNTLRIDSRQIVWKRVIDMNDRALRNVVVGLGGKVCGFTREDGFMITVASEVMAILCLSNDLMDLKERLGKIIVAYNLDGAPVTAKEIGVHGAMAMLLKDAIKPNLVQTLEHTPAFIHGGPFANIAHGCNSVIATKLGLKLGDILVTEAGFGADLGAEKFLDIKCRYANLKPDAVVIVATIRALKMHGGVKKADLGIENLEALNQGFANLQKQVENIEGKYPIYGSGGIIGRSNAYICNENSIIIGRKGNINKPILVKEKFWNVDTAFGLEVKSENMSYHYLYYFCLFYDFEIHNKAVTIPSLVKSDLEKIVLPVPPIELQNKFAERIEKIEKLKFDFKDFLFFKRSPYKREVA